MQTFAVTLGRGLLGLYFLLPGISKVTGYAGTLDYMALHNIPLPEVLLPITIVLQIGGGLMLIFGLRVGQIALMFAALTLAINCLLYTSPSPRDRQKSRMPSSA